MTFSLLGITSYVGSKIFSAVTGIGLGSFFSGAFALAFDLDEALRFFFLLPFSPGRRMPMVFFGRSITWP